MVKTKKEMSGRGIRFEIDSWKKMEHLARVESVKTDSNVTPSDIVRHACEVYIKKNKSKLNG